MAYIGMRKPRFAPITTPRVDGSAITYGTPIVLGPAVSANVTFDVADNPDYGDDIVQNNDNGINGYSIAMELNDISAEGRAKCLGWKDGIVAAMLSRFARFSGVMVPFITWCASAGTLAL